MPGCENGDNPSEGMKILYMNIYAMLYKGYNGWDAHLACKASQILAVQYIFIAVSKLGKTSMDKTRALFRLRKINVWNWF